MTVSPIRPLLDLTKPSPVCEGVVMSAASALVSVPAGSGRLPDELLTQVEGLVARMVSRGYVGRVLACELLGSHELRQVRAVWEAAAYERGRVSVLVERERERVEGAGGSVAA